MNPPLPDRRSKPNKANQVLWLIISVMFGVTGFLLSRFYVRAEAAAYDNHFSVMEKCNSYTDAQIKALKKETDDIKSLVVAGQFKINSMDRNVQRIADYLEFKQGADLSHGSRSHDKE